MFRKQERVKHRQWNWETWSTLRIGGTAPLSMTPIWPPGAGSAWPRNWIRLWTMRRSLIRATLDKVKERIEGMDPEELAAGQIPAALRTLIELELKVLGYEDRVVLTGKDGGPVRTEITGKDGGPVKTQHVFQPTPELWDNVLRIRAEYERLRDGDTDEDTAADSL